MKLKIQNILEIRAAAAPHHSARTRSLQAHAGLRFHFTVGRRLHFLRTSAESLQGDTMNRPRQMRGCVYSGSVDAAGDANHGGSRQACASHRRSSATGCGQFHGYRSAHRACLDRVAAHQCSSCSTACVAPVRGRGTSGRRQRAVSKPLARASEILATI